MRMLIMANWTRSATLIWRWLSLLPLFAAGPARAAETVDATAIMQRVLANRPALSLWLEAELRIERKTAESFDLNIFFNGDPREVRTAYRVTAPDEVAGKAVLMIEGGDIWLCEKGQSEPRKLAPAERATPFLGGDFAYEDLELAFLRWPQHRFVRESRRLGFDCWVIESKPGAQTPSQYGRVLSWVDKQYLAVVIAEAYDAQGRLLKNLEVKSVRKLDERHYIVGQIALTNVQARSRTVLRVLEDHKAALTPEFFSPETFCKAVAAPPKKE
ncbi:MAG: outer membrane lipoprotein-sorting protein [Verrucomicrobiae bacterium]|nr:outer membrane lipoprotein-sorting protein [Verrucomicrobiae bacterium]